MICGRSSKLDIVNFFISFIGSSFSYGLLFFTFSSFDSRILVYDMISVFLLSLNFLIEFLTIAKRQFKKIFKNSSRSKGKISDSTEIDIQSKILLDQKDLKGMVNKLGDKYGMPFVGTHKTIVRSILESAHN